MWINLFGIVAIFAAIVGLATKFLGLDADSALWVTIPLALAGASALLWLAFNARGLARLATSRSARYGVNMFAVSVVVIFIVVMLNVVVTSKRIHWDTTSNARNSLAPQSTQVVAGLDDDIMVTANIIPELAGTPFGSPLTPSIFEEQMQLYRAASSRLSYRVIDARENPQDAEGLPRPIQPGDIFVTHGDRTQTVGPYRLSDLEEKITRAIITVTREQQRTVYFPTRHEEELFAPGTGLSQLREALENELCEVEAIDLLREGEVPDDCSVLFIADPAYQFTDADLTALTQLINRGGQVIVCLEIEPVLDGSADSTLVAYLRQFGCEVGDDIVIEESLGLVGFDVRRRFTPNLEVAEFDEVHLITESLFQPMTVPYARSISADDLPRGVDAELLFSSGRASWAEADLDLFRTGATAPEKCTLRSLVPLAQVFTIEVAQRPAVFTPATAETPAGAPTQLILEESETEEIRDITEEDLIPGGAVSDDPTFVSPEIAAMLAELISETPPPGTPPARVIVIGDTSFLGDRHMVPGASGNRDFILNAINFLASDTDLIAIRPRDNINTGFAMSAMEHRILLVLLIAFPLLVALAGVTVIVRRRRLA